MARIPLPEAEDLRGWQRDQYGRFPSHLTRTLVLLDERLARALPDTANALRAAPLDARQREGIILRVAALTGSAYERAQHLDQARALGWTTDQIRIIETTGTGVGTGVGRAVAREPDTPMRVASATPPASLPDGFADVLEFVDACVAGHAVTDDLFVRVRDVLSDRDLITVIVLVGHYLTVARLSSLLNLQPDPVPGPWDHEH
ncbi:carboxymuconolactone decarboxylase family protein [Amycolatopsis sp. PS_44_ISF1]|uniref:carboxymuconolactone decarboxylase family protein n=1 Tax=Amycolatopsis sp. PS_44_ISF1 TaxID=2974917 RepID=UPI0028DE7DBB|nr:carboxymuconolactone decarboxylase family protein [Amycolatopsis sp. PS_44_ISF1]MDT8915663.1 carboxymuconolactone decarboxylase family protein [Amycolatopsis sp. PS_44_ISF1]